jgi:hypothetical protein
MDARSNPSLSATSLSYAPVAQLDRAPGYEPGGREFESLRAHHLKSKRPHLRGAFLFVRTLSLRATINPSVIP